jgi:hypothetical protein
MNMSYNDFFFVFGRSTVLSSTIPPSMQPSFPPYANKQITQEAFKTSRASESNSLSQSKGSRPPPRAPAGMNYIVSVILVMIINCSRGCS